MAPFITMIWEKLPRPLRWIIIAAFIIIYTPLKLREEAIQFIDARVYANITPMKERRDLQIAGMEGDIDEIKDDVKWLIRNHPRAPREPQETK